MVKNKRKTWLLLLLWPIAAAVLLLCRVIPGFAEYIFARGIYKYYHTALAFLSGLAPLSVAELLAYALVLGCLALLAAWVVRLVKEKGGRGRLVRRGVAHMLCLGGVLFFLFVFGCGGNYYRDTYAASTGLTVTQSSNEELRDLCMDLTLRANAVRARLTDCEDADGVFRLPYSTRELKAQSQRAMTAMGEAVPVLSGYYASPKSVLWSRGLTQLGITGIYMPFTAEANVNVDVTDDSLGAAMCHELSHMAGFMREDEANFIAYQACTAYGDDVLAYSGLRLALSYAGSALYKSAPDLYYAVMNQYSEALIRDIKAEVAHWQPYEDTTASKLGENINDAYLKANNQAAGTKSYGAMVDLLLADYKRTHE